MNRRLEALEERMGASEEEVREEAQRGFLRRLTREELEWISEPADEAARRTPCPHSTLTRRACWRVECGTRALDEHPELYREMQERWQSLCERSEEILQREEEGGR